MVLPLLLALAMAQDPMDLARLKDYQAARVSSNNPDPNSNDDSVRPIPGQTIVLADLTGPGVVNHIWLTIASNMYGWPRLLRLRVYYDGSATPSVDAPVGDFFGVGHGQEKPLQSMMVRNGSSGRARNSYWAMPFRKSCKITLTNEGRRRVSNVYYHVDWKKVPSLAADIGYFHAWYKQELPAKKGQFYDVLNVAGRGHLVGAVLNVIQAEPGWFGEGDDLFYIDGEKKPRLEGTGTEDYFNDAWSLRVADGLYTGVTIAEGTGLGARLSAYRWHVTDAIPFTRSLRFAFEHAGWTYNADGRVRSAFEERADLFSSTAFWYQQGIATGLQPAPYGPARLPHGNATQIEVEQSAALAGAERGKIRVDKEVFWSRDLLVLQAEGPGSRIQIPFDVASDGQYELIAQIAHAPDYGSYRVLLDGKPITSGAPLENEPGANMGGEAPIDAYFTEVYVAEDHLLGWPRLTAGRHQLTFICAGRNQASTGYDLGIDTLVLARVASPVTVEDPLPKRGEEMAALESADPIVRGLAALGVAGRKEAVPRLTALLADEDENVRLASAESLAAAGPAAAPAVAALMQAAQRPGEHVQVLRPIAKALGRIGKAAEPALPVLEKLSEVPRVSWAAQEAMARIRSAR
jgi:hypothetical protein